MSTVLLLEDMTLGVLAYVVCNKVGQNYGLTFQLFGYGKLNKLLANLIFNSPKLTNISTQSAGH